MLYINSHHVCESDKNISKDNPKRNVQISPRETHVDDELVLIDEKEPKDF